MKTFMKIMISVALILTLTMTACSNTIYAVGKSISELDTPIADIPNDTYMPFSEKEKEMQSAQALVKDMKALGGSVSVYGSEEEYIEACNQESASNETVLSDISFEPVKQTITVMTTATGSNENNNYIASQPLPNAIVRINGVPRYTDRKGQVKVTLNSEFVELFIEKDEYNPHMEFFDVTGDDKVVYMKKMSDDIDIYGAIVEYIGENINVLNAKCYVNKSQLQDYFDLTILTNVIPEESYILVNGEKRFYSSTGVFYHLDFSEYSKNDKFELQIYYNDIASRIYTLNIIVVEAKVDVNKILNSAFTSLQHEQVDLGDNHIKDIGSIDTQFTHTVLDYITGNIKSGAALNFGDHSATFNYLYFPQTGKMEFTIGYSYEFDTKTTKQIEDKLTQKFADNKSRNDEINKIQNDIVGLNNEIDKIERKMKKSDAIKEAYILEKSQKISELEAKRAAFETATNDPIYKENEKEINRLNKQKNDNLRGHQKRADIRNEQIENAVDSINKGNADIESLNKLISNLPEIKSMRSKLYGIFKNGVKTGHHFDADIELAFAGTLGYSLVAEEFMGVKIAAGAKLKVSYTYQTIIMSVPCFVKGTVEGGLSVEFIVNAETTLTAEAFLKKFSIILTCDVGLDLGVGISGLVSASIFGNVGFEIDCSIGCIIDGKQPFEIKLNYGYGLRLKVLWYDYEISHYEDIILLEREEDNKESLFKVQLMQRSGDQVLSENQRFSNIFQSSKSKLVEYDGKQMLFWLEDSPGRDDYNRTILKWSALIDGTWTMPIAVNNDSKADLNFDVINHKGDLYIVYQKSNIQFDKNSQVQDILKEQEIMLSKFNPETNNFEVCAQLTNNSVMDVMPQFAVSDSSALAVTWMSNSNNDAFGATGENSIFVSKLSDDVWGQPDLLYKTKKMIRGRSTAVKDGRVNIALAIDQDDDYLTIDTELLVINESGEIGTAQAGAANPIYALTNGKVGLYYSKDGQLIRSDNYHDEVLLCSTETIGDEFELITSGSNIYIAYQKTAGDYKQSFCSIYDAATDHWTYDIPLAKEKGNMTNTYIQCIDKKIIFSYNLQNEEYVTGLCVVEKAFSTDLKINSVNYLESLTEGAVSELCVEVSNVGDTDIYNLRFNIFNENIDLKLIDPLKVGTSDYYFISVLTEMTYNQDALLIVSALTDAGMLLGSSEYIVETILTEVSLHAEAYLLNQVQKIKVNAFNSSLYGTNSILNIYCNGVILDTIEFSIEGMQAVDFDLEYIELKENDFLYIEIVTEKRDANTGNNEVSLYSLQDYVTPYEAPENMYLDSLNYGKGLLI